MANILYRDLYTVCCCACRGWKPCKPQGRWRALVCPTSTSCSWRGFLLCAGCHPLSIRCYILSSGLGLHFYKCFKKNPNIQMCLCHIMFTLNERELTFMLVRGWDIGGITTEKNGYQETTVWYGVLLCAEISLFLWWEVLEINTWSFPNPNQGVFVLNPNQSISTVLS